MPEFEELGERIKICVSEVGGYEAMSAKTGIPIRTLNNYASGQNDLKTTALIRIAQAANRPLEWLAIGGEASKNMGFADIPQQRFSGEGRGIAPVPVLNLKASAGDGAVVIDESEVGTIGFARNWLSQLGLNPSELFTLPTVGESMEPTIKAGEYLLCSKALHHTQPGDGIFVIRLEGNVLVKRLQRLPGEFIEVSSDNKEFYQPFKVKMNDGVDFQILGKVVIVHGIRRV